MAPVVRALAARPFVEQRLVLTGQHRDLGASFGGLARAAVDDLQIDVAELSAGEAVERMHDRLCGVLRGLAADLVLVQGDTTSALAGALAARDCAIAIGHVEAGLRSFDLDQPWPEEGNRVRIDRLAKLLFAPTEQAARNLAADARLNGQVFVTGNSGIDALFGAREERPHQVAAASARKLVLVTCHRRENRGEALGNICDAIDRMVAEFPVEVVLPLHPNPGLRREIERRLGRSRHITLLGPVDHAEMVRLIERSWIILTDSGGLQEEGAAMGRPVLVLRNVTERIEAEANIALVGTDPGRILAAVSSLLTDDIRYARMATPSRAFGDGRAATRIADAIEAFLSPVATSAP